MAPEPHSSDKVPSERFIGSHDDVHILEKPVTDRSGITAQRLAQLDRQINSAAMTTSRSRNTLIEVVDRRENGKESVMASEKTLMLGELERIVEYERIALFAETVWAGKHPKFKIPANVIRQSSRYAPFNENFWPSAVTRKQATKRPLALKQARPTENRLVDQNEEPNAISDIKQQPVFPATAVLVDRLGPETANWHDLGRIRAVIGQDMLAKQQSIALYSHAADNIQVTGTSSNAIMETESGFEIVSPTGYRRAQPPRVEIDILSSSSDDGFAPPRSESRRNSLTFKVPELRFLNSTHSLIAQSFDNPAIKSETGALNQGLRLLTAHDASTAAKGLTQSWNIIDLVGKERKLFTALQRTKRAKHNLACPNSKARVVQRAKKDLVELEALVRRRVVECQMSPERLRWLMKEAGLL